MKNLHEKITVQIVLFEENFELIKTCLSTLRGIKIIIVDNKKDLELKKKITSQFAIEKYILNQKNLGYSKGHNQASHYVKTEYMLILNADCVIEKLSIQNLIKTIDNNDQCGLISPTTYDEDNNLTYSSGFFPERGPKGIPLTLEGDTCVQTVLGSSMLISKKLFNELNGFDENFFLYFSDDELCKRIYEKKFSIIQSFTSKANHTHGITKVKNFFKKIFLREFHYTFDELYYYYKHDLNNSIFEKNKKKKNIYLFKFLTSLIFFKFKKCIFYLARFLALSKFFKKIDKR
jgi:N-acetylglucosaminyl-diphospho-decaprenol L-rhamnosyltransferase